MAIPFLDTNVFLRHLRQDIPDQSAKATELFRRIEAGALTVRTSDIVIFETVFSLQRGYHEPRERIAQALLPLIELPGIVLPGKRYYRDVFALYVSLSPGFADCYHAVLMKRLKLTEILTFDPDFDKLPDVHRMKLSQNSAGTEGAAENI